MATVTLKPTKAQQEFIDQYQAAEKVATSSSGGVRFLEKDRLLLAKKLLDMIKHGGFANLNNAAILIAIGLNDGSTHERHQWRLRSWVRELDRVANSTIATPSIKCPPTKSVIEPITTATAKPAPKPVEPKPVGSVPVTTALQPNDGLRFMTNSIEQVKSLCLVAMRRGLTREKIMSILNGGMNEAVDEHADNKLKVEFAAFLRERNITASVAVEVLQKM